MQPDLQAHLSTAADGRSFQGACTDLDLAADEAVAQVEFGAGCAPALQIGERTLLSFRGGRLASSVEVDSLAVSRVDGPARRCYSFHLNQIPESLRIATNRRSSTRVRPQAIKPVRVRFFDDKGAVLSQAIVHDISSSGLSVIVDQSLEAHLFQLERARLSVLLPVSSDAFEVVALIRNRRLFGSAVLYGLEFEKERPESARARERITSFLECLQRAAPLGPRA